MVKEVCVVLTCEVCGKRLKNASGLAGHCRLAHNEVGGPSSRKSEMVDALRSVEIALQVLAESSAGLSLENIRNMPGLSILASDRFDFDKVVSEMSPKTAAAIKNLSGAVVKFAHDEGKEKADLFEDNLSLLARVIGHLAMTPKATAEGAECWGRLVLQVLGGVHLVKFLASRPGLVPSSVPGSLVAVTE